MPELDRKVELVRWSVHYDCTEFYVGFEYDECVNALLRRKERESGYLYGFFGCREYGAFRDNVGQCNY